MKNVLFSLVAIAMLMSFQIQTRKFSQRTNGKIDSIIAYHINSGLTTFTPIPCNDVRNYSSDLKIFNLTKFKERIFSALPPKNATTFDWSPDARTQIEIFYHSGIIDTICLCRLSKACIDHKMYNMGSDVSFLLDSLFNDALDKEEKK